MISNKQWNKAKKILQNVVAISSSALLKHHYKKIWFILEQ
jgi:hypothetical protein